MQRSRGRPRRTTATATVVVTARLTEDENADLERLVARYGVATRSDALRLLVDLAAAETPDQIRDVSRRVDLLCAAVPHRALPEGAVLFTKEEISRPAVAEAVLPGLLRFVVAHVQRYGWTLPPTPLAVAQALAAVRSAAVPGPIYSGRGRVGVDFLKNRIPAFWQTFRGPQETMRDPVKLQRLLRHMLGLSSAGRAVDFTWGTFRRAFAQQNLTVSFFRPAVAAGIYARWLDGHTAPVVWDPSAGFGARMLGFFAMFPRGTYHANEPATLTHRDLCALAAEMPGSAHIERAGSEFARWAPGTLDLVFTSPPYFDTERYFNEPGQVWVEYKTRAAWRDRQVIPTLRAAFTGLKPGAYAVININQMHRDVYHDAALSVGFEFVTEEELVLHRTPWARTASTLTDAATQTEPILVYRKPAP